ncbi:hypothetical protein CHS0354_014049 [Potamilus streckersoni]|uniref:Uncharacterized protein n=1 Tax=Potamilus streckersoni TaxID=2493646 RepID=A0AAE0VPX0_9BIVA|nr:hypothetical protein CHS0354_014049 [Potamilus streckersoni]
MSLSTVVEQFDKAPERASTTSVVDKITFPSPVDEDPGVSLTTSAVDDILNKSISNKFDNSKFAVSKAKKRKTLVQPECSQRTSGFTKQKQMKRKRMKQRKGKEKKRKNIARKEKRTDEKFSKNTKRSFKNKIVPK